MTKIITIAVSEEGDWEGLYVDGQLEAEGHSLDTSEILKALGHKFQRRQVPSELFERHGYYLPQTVEELPDAGTS